MSKAMSKARVFLAVFSAIVVPALVPAVVHAQGGASGSIIGYVFDEAGMPLKGVKISATSPTQIGGAKNGYTNDEGAFRIPQLDPGKFEVRASAPKLETIVNKDVKVGISSATELNIIMKVMTKTETVAIIEKPPIVKTTKSNITETFDLDMVEALPHGSRDNVHNQVINDVAGGMNNRVRGGSTAQTMFTQDGFEMRGQFPTLKSSAAYEVNTGGFGVDNPMASGGSVNLVTKSGSNKFEFEFNATADSNRLRFFRDENDSPAPTYFYVINPMISGPIIKDKLWFHFNTESHILQGDDRTPDPEHIFPDNATYKKFIQKGTLKLTWQVNGRNKVYSLTNFDSPHEWNMIKTVGTAPEAQRTRHGFRLMEGVVWESLLTDSLVFRTQVGFIMIPQHRYPSICDTNHDTCDSIPAEKQTMVGNLSRDSFFGNSSDEAHQRLDNYSIQFTNGLEYFFDAGSWGSHALKLKENFLAEQDIVRKSRPGDRLYEYAGSAGGVPIPSALTTYYSNDPRKEEARYGWFIGTSNTARHIVTLSDTFKATRYLTLIPAVSHAYANAFNSSGESVLDSQAFAFAGSVAWDATHDGRTVIRGSYNQYVDISVFDVAKHTQGDQVSQKCKWDTVTSTYSKECEFSGGGASTRTVGRPCGPSGIDEFGKKCTEQLKVPRTFEYTLGAEREVVPGIALAFDMVYKNFKNQYEVRETNRIWNNGGTDLNLAGRYRNGRAEKILDIGTPDEAKRTYRGATIGINKREGRFKSKVSYTLSSLEGNVFDGTDNPWGDVPPQDVYLYGPLADDHRHEVKWQATYAVTPWLSTGLRYRYFSGTPYNRLFNETPDNKWDSYRARTGTNPGVDLNNPDDDRELRMPDMQDFNMQIRANLMPFLGQAVDFYVDILNVLNLRTVTKYNNEDRAFGQITGRMDPFRIRLGINVKY
jgi:hypothetical protein